jgi:hypothetical protein
MQPNNEIVLLKTSLSYKPFCFYLFGILFFGAFSLFLFPMEMRDEESSKIAFSFAMLFSLPAIACLIAILVSKTVTLTNHTLIVKRPFLGMNNRTALSEIVQLMETPYAIDTGKSHIFTGNQILITLRHAGKIKINSFETPEYFKLTLALSKLTQGFEIQDRFSNRKRI